MRPVGRRAVRRSRRGGEPHAAARSRRRDQGAHRRPRCAPTVPRRPRSTVTTEPRALDDETVLERVMVIARNRALAVHHVTVHAIGGRLSVSLDLEVDGSLSLAPRARDRRRARSRRCARSSDPRSRSRPISSRCSRDDRPAATRRPSAIAAVRDALAEIAAKVDFVGEMHDVRVRETDDGEIVNFHCRVDPALDACRRAREGRRGGARAAAALSRRSSA